MRGKILLISLLVCSSLRAETIVSGNVQGVWDSTGNPYRVIGDVTVPGGQFLSILSGVEIKFEGDFYFTVGGSLTARGTITDSVKFFYAFGQTPGAWKYIDFNNSPFDSASLSYCQIESGERAIQVTDCRVTLDHCLIQRHSLAPVKGINSAQIYLNSCLITNNDASGIALQSSSAVITDCSITYSGGNGHGINTTENSSVTLNGGYIGHNQGSGVYSQESGPLTIFNTEIADNIYGISSVNSGNLEGSRAVIYDNQLHGISLTGTTLHAHNFTISSNDGYGIFFSGSNKILELSSSIIDHNNLWGIYCQTGIDLLNYNNNYLNVGGSYSGCDSGMGAIAADPEYLSYIGRDFHLNEGSPCIDTGSPFDPLDPDQTHTDMGAFWFDQSPVRYFDNPATFSNFRIISAYPNPFNPSISLQIETPNRMQGSLEAWDAQGRQVAQIWAGQINAGINQFTWNASALASGIYFLRLQSSQNTDQVRCILLK